MDILEKIMAHKRKEVEERKALFPVKLLEQSIYFTGQPVSMKKYLLRADKTGIIAEFKRKSPSKGDINPYAQVERTSIGYMQAGASALSVLTDSAFFGGKNEDLSVARKFNYCPILRKDFVYDEYQIIEAKSIGADAILLIAAVLSPEEIKKLAAFAQSFGMEVLLEVHNKQELLENLGANIDLVGVNNRNLKTFDVSIQTSLELAELIPDEKIKISESGIFDPAKILELKKAGYRGFLIGENFMRHGRPEKEAQAFMNKLRLLEKQVLSSKA